VFNHIEKAPMPFFVKPIAKAIAKKTKDSFINPQIKSHLDYIEVELGKTKWFAGNEFSGADIQMSFPLEAAAARGGLDASYPKASAYLKRIHARPAYKRALERGGEYSLMS
jgi:glutathione S-transferase